MYVHSSSFLLVLEFWPLWGAAWSRLFPPSHSAVDVLAEALSQRTRSARLYLTARESFRYLGPSPRMRAFARKLSLNLSSTAASFGVSSSISIVAGFAPLLASFILHLQTRHTCALE